MSGVSEVAANATDDIESSFFEILVEIFGCNKEDLTI